MTCDSCHLEKKHLIGAIIKGKYGQYCQACIDGVKRHATGSSAQYQRDRERDAHQADMLQPWDAKGKPNTEFIRHYPDESKDMFTQEELEQNG